MADLPLANFDAFLAENHFSTPLDGPEGCGPVTAPATPQSRSYQNWLIHEWHQFMGAQAL